MSENQQHTPTVMDDAIKGYADGIRNKDITVIKRNDSYADYEPDKIRRAIRQCFKRCRVRYRAELLDKIDNEIKYYIAKNMEIYPAGSPAPMGAYTIKVEEIQDIVENVLMASNPNCAKEYILYRNHREQVRSWVDSKEEFIRKYKESTNTANATIDDNSNVTNKNIGILNTEIHKEDNIQISRRMVVRKLREIFPDFDAKQYERDLESHIIYKHDESSFAGAVAPYTYSAKEVVRVLYNGNQLLVPFDLLYSIIEEPEFLVDSENVVFQKRPDDLYVMDRNDWVRATVITKKKRHRDLYRIKTSFGEDIVVTDNHPLITDPESIDKTVSAVDSLGASQWKFTHKLDFRGESKIDLSDILPESKIYESFIRLYSQDSKRIIDLNEPFGYVVGFFIGDGNYHDHNECLNFSQKDEAILDRINNILFETTGNTGYIKYDEVSEIFSLQVRSRALFKLFRDYFHIEDKAQGKTLPINILDFTEDFAKGILEGLYDAAGTANNDQLWLKLSSRAAILQVSELMRHFGYSVTNGLSGYKTNYNLWAMSCSRRDGCTEFDMSYKWKKVGISKSSPTYKPSGEVKITNVQKIDENDSFLMQNEFIYDMTTDSHSFIMNNILVHNCVALTMYPFLDGGIKGIGGLSAKPKNLDSYCGMLVNMIFAISAQFAGACLYKDQRLIVREDGVLKSLKISDIVSKFNTKYELHNSEGDWEVAMVNGNLEVWEDGKFVNISKVYRRKYDDKIYRIHTYGGKVITTSKDHRFKVRFRDRDFEVKAKDLKVNDTLYRTDKTDYPIDKASKDYKDGQLYGIIAGDGSININGIHVAVNYKEAFISDWLISDWLDNYFHEYKGKPGILRDGHKCYQWEFNSREYAAWLADNIFDGTDAYTKSLRDDVFENASLEFLCGFLDGILATNGSFQNNVHGLMLTNEKLIKQISEIVIRLGKYVSPIKYYEKSGSFKNANPAWKINISKSINPYLDLTSIRRSSNHKYMNDTIKSTYYYGGNAFKHSVGKDKAYCIRDYSKVPVHNLDAIKSIEVIDNDDDYVYEIETETHWYSAGDVLTHNCAVPEALLYFDYFARKEWGDDYYLHTEDIVNPRSQHPRTIREQIHQHFQQVVYSINQPAAARGLQSAFVNFSYYDKAFYEGMFGNFVFPDFTKPIWESFNWLQKDFMQWFNDERKKCILTFPVESFAMVYQDHEFLDPESADFVAEEYARGHSFFTYISDTVDSLSSCCRLKNRLQTKEFNFTNGNMGLQTGSKSVITINLNRTIQDWARLNNRIAGASGLSKEEQEGLIEYLGAIVDRIYKYHTAYNELLWDMKDAHLLPVYDAGFIDLNKQYLTIGINGLNQAAEFLGYTCNDNEQYKQFCQLIFGAIAAKNKEAGKEKFNGHTLTFNTEQVPAESLAIKNYNWDKEDDYWVPEDTNLYASYIFKPNDPTTDIFEKLRMHGREYIGDYLDGGSAAHINLEEHLTKDQYRNIIKYAAEQGTNYFTFNIPMSECCDCGHIVNGPVDECPICHSHNIKYWVRIIGYLTAVTSWSAGRRAEFGTRIFHSMNKDKYSTYRQG